MGKDVILSIRALNFFYSDVQVLKNISLDVYSQTVTALIGPSGCGKTTLLRCCNRMNDLINDTRAEGEILFHNQNIYTDSIDPVEIRRCIGMVFQKPNPFPKSIRENIAWGARINGYKGNMDELVEQSLKRTALWDEVKDKLHHSALDLSGGQQQRLCIARTIAIQPNIILMDEPTSALDPVSTGKIESLIAELKEHYAIIIVTHNMQQAGRVSDYTSFLLNGELIESGQTGNLFLNPKHERTEAYISGRFG